MQEKIVDARGLSCPEPVIRTARAISEGAEHIEVLVDTDTARENVLRLAAKKGYEASVQEERGCFRILLGRRREDK